MSYNPPIPPGNNIQISQQQLDAFLDGIRAVNDNIRQLTESLSGYLKAHNDELDLQNQFMEKRVGLQRQLNSEVEYGAEMEEALAASQQELERGRSEAMQEQVRAGRELIEIHKRLRAAQGDPGEYMNILRERANIQQTPEGEVLAHGRARIPLADIENAARTPLGERSEQQVNMLGQMNEIISQNLRTAVRDRAPRAAERILDAVEESGLRQLRYGQLPLQDLLRSAGTLAGRGYGAMLPQIQPPGAPQQAIGFGSRLGLGALGGAARFLPMIGQALGGGTLAMEAFSAQMQRMFREPARMGQLTGEGWRAGIGASWRGRMLGMNPFDMVDAQTAAQIVEATRSRGFQTQDRDAVMEGMRDVINDLGISVDAAASYFEDAMLKGGQSVDEVRKTLQTFDDEAKQLGININDYTQQVMTNVQTLRAGGAGNAAPGIAQALIAGSPRGMTTEASAAYNQIFQAARGDIAARMGIRVTDVTSERYSRAAFGQLEDVIGREIELARNLGYDNINDIANYLSQNGIYTRGVSAEVLEGILNRMDQGRGPSAQVAVRQARHDYTARFHELRGSRQTTMQFGNMSRSQRRAAGIEMRDDGTGVLRPYDREGNPVTWHSDIMFTEQGRMEDIPIDKLRQLRMSTIDQLAQAGALTGEKLAEFRKRAGDRDFDVIKELKGLSTGPGQSDSRITTPGGIVIELRPGVEKEIFRLREGRRKGVVPSNQLR